MGELTYGVRLTTQAQLINLKKAMSFFENEVPVVIRRKKWK